MGENVPLIIGAIAAAIAGGVVGWLWATSRTRRQEAARLQDLDRRLAAQEGSAAAVREELRRGREIIERLQTELRAVAAEKADAEARASESRAGLDEQKHLLEEAKARLTEAFRA